MKKFCSFFLSCLLLLSLCACALPGLSSAGSADASAASSAGASSEILPPETPPDPVETLLSALTLEQKVGQLFFVRVPTDSALADITAYHLGGYILFGRDTKDLTANQLIQTLNAYQETSGAANGIPMLLGVDEEGGTVVRVSSNSHLRERAFLSPQALYALAGMEEIAYDTHEKDVLLAALGFNVNLAPVADVSTDKHDFIYPRTFGQNAQATANYVELVVAQMTDDGMGSVLKHFPGYGNNVDTHTGIATDNRTLESFQSGDFLPFTAGIAAGRRQGGQSSAVLVSHNIMTAVDETLPASLSPAVHQLLRDELDFTGVVMTDDLAMEAVAAYAKDGDVAVLALEAGNDLLITTDYRTQIPKVLAAVENGTLDESTVEDACRRVLQWKQTLGLLA